MAKIFLIILLLCGLFSAPLAARNKKRIAKKIRIVIVTELGKIEAELWPDNAPLTVENFLRYVDGGFYEGGNFHRTVTTNPDNQPNNNIKIAVIQAAINNAKVKPSFAPVALERTNKTNLNHADGTISMARAAPDSATSDFFICIGAQPELDFGGKRNPDGQGFAAFGRITKGMNVVRQIQAAKSDGQKLTPPIKILQVRRK